MMEPGQTNTASWMVVGEVHNDDSQLPNGWSSSPPVAIMLNGDHLQVVARYAPTGVNPNDSAGNDTLMTLWTDPNPIVRGQYYNIDINANVVNNSSGYLKVSIDGQQVVNYSGMLGYGTHTYWEEGLLSVDDEPGSGRRLSQSDHLDRRGRSASVVEQHFRVGHGSHVAKRRADSDAGLRFTGDGNRACRRCHHNDARL